MPLGALPSPSGPSHFLFSSKTDSVPTLDELVQLESELKSLRAEAVSRGEKANSGSTAVNEFWRKAKEKTKELTRERMAKSKDGEKIKAIKIKRETTGTPDVEESDMRYNSYPTTNGHASKGYSSNRSFALAPTTYKKSKLGPSKKRKHADSDGEASDNAGVSHPHKSSKANGSSKLTGHGSSHNQANPRVAEDFTLPNRETVPTRPNLSTLSIFPYLHQTPVDEPPPLRTEKSSLSRNNSSLPPIASSSKEPRDDVYAARSAMNSNPLSVMDDFSAARQPPNQTTIHTFWTAAEPWIKTMGIEDLANLELEGDEVQPYEFVPLGRHYLDRWDDEDTQAFAEELGAPSSSNLPSHSASSAVASALSADSQQPWDPTSIGPSDLVRDERSLGTVRARILAAFLPVPGGVTIGKEEGGGEGDEREKERRTGTGSTTVMGVLDVPDLEDRLRAEASAIGLLGDDDSEPIIPVDDEIASSLRRLQRILRAQSTLNGLRKRILKDRADEALAFADYRTTLRQTLDKPISAAYTKILRSSASKPGKKNKKSGSGTVGAAEENLSAGGIPLELPLELVKRVRLRQRFVEAVRASLQGGEEDEGMSGRKQPRHSIAMVHFPTEVFLPERSIYEGVEEEAEKEIGWPFRSVVAGVVESSVDEHSSNGTNGATK